MELPHLQHQLLFDFISKPLNLTLHLKLRPKLTSPPQKFSYDVHSQTTFLFFSFFSNHYCKLWEPRHICWIDSGCHIVQFLELGTKEGRGTVQAEWLRESLCLLMDLRGADEVICLCRDTQHVMVTRERTVFIKFCKVLYKIYFIEYVTCIQKVTKST